jgi:hypothetical protein
MPNNEHKEQVNHPSHYGGADNPYEVIKVIEAWEKYFKLSFNLLTAIKYIPRAGRKDPAKRIEDLKKAIWYINREITNLSCLEYEQLKLNEKKEVNKQFKEFVEDRISKNSEE